MTTAGVAQILLFFGIVVLAARPLGLYMARVFAGDDVMLSRVLRPVERIFYRAAGVKPDDEQSWKGYAASVLVFHLAGVVVVYVVQRIQGSLPLNPQGFGSPTPDVAWNTAVSFATNTNWQAYGGEISLSYLTQMLVLTVQNFTSAAAGIAVVVALTRGIARTGTTNLGSFWVDLVRATLYVLLPLSFVAALFFASQGVVQTFAGSHTAHLMQTTAGPDGKPVLDQVIAVGPVASQLAIKQIGTNGGGFFNANSAHPFENPTPLTNFVEIVLIFLLPAALTATFGAMVKDARQGRALLAAMLVLCVPLVFACVAAEQAGNPALAHAHAGALHVDQAMSALSPGGNMEGKEVRFGISGTALFATVTTSASCGAVNGMHDSFTPLGGLVPLWLIQLGEVVFGGVGSGLYGMLVFAILAVFIAGLMVGRTPEYLGKKIEAFEMKMASLVILLPASAVLLGTGLAVATEAGRRGVLNPGPHGFTEVLYAFSSAANNNGSAFAGLSVNTAFYDVALGVAMFIGRFWVMVPVLALAGALAEKKRVPPGAGTLPTHKALFVGLLVGTVVLVGALTFIPALALGPVVEHLLARGS